MHMYDLFSHYSHYEDRLILQGAESVPDMNAYPRNDNGDVYNEYMPK